MTLKHALLASLLGGEASAYDLTKRFAAGVAEFWNASPAQCYAEVNRLRAAGLVTAREVPATTGPPVKRLLAITDAGLAELNRHIDSPLEAATVKDDLLVRVTCLDAVDTHAVLAALSATRIAAREAVVRYEAMRSAMLRGRTESAYLQTARRIGPYLALDRGISFQTELATWCDRAEQIVRTRSAVLSRGTR